MTDDVLTIGTQGSDLHPRGQRDFAAEIQLVAGRDPQVLSLAVETAARAIGEGHAWHVCRGRRSIDRRRRMATDRVARSAGAARFIELPMGDQVAAAKLGPDRLDHVRAAAQQAQRDRGKGPTDPKRHHCV